MPSNSQYNATRYVQLETWGLPEWEVRGHTCVHVVTVYSHGRDRTYASEKLMQSVIGRVKNGKAEVSLGPLHRLTPRCDAPSAVVLATARVVAETRSNEVCRKESFF